MEQITIKAAMDCIKTYGRTYYDAQDGVLYSNYTCGTFEVEFTGTLLAASFRAIPDTMSPPPRNTLPNQEVPNREDWPYIAVFLDDAEEPAQTIRVRDNETIVLYFSETTQTHRIKIVKLTENFRTALGIAAFQAEGTLNSFAANSKDVIEFIGDSITCGFGNATSDVAHEFEASEENGWMTHGAIAARALGLAPRFICVSGISIEKSPAMPGLYSMRELYPYVDRILEDKLAEQRGTAVPAYRRFEFAAHPARYVVLNLGTNDASQIYFSPNQEQAEQEFEQNYYRFVSELRTLHGPQTTIICALGCMDYYLFDKIQAAVSRLKSDTGDTNIVILKYHKMMNLGQDVGACMHPSIYRHQLMAQDLIACIQNLPVP